MFAKNSDLDRFANSAASLAAVFFWIDSRRLYTIWLICVLSESISPDASTVMNRVKSPSVAAAEICAKPRTCEVRFAAIVLTDILPAHQRISPAPQVAQNQEDVRDRLPSALDIRHFRLHT
jgi:hypothetical protein